MKLTTILLLIFVGLVAPAYAHENDSQPPIIHTNIYQSYQDTAPVDPGLETRDVVKGGLILGAMYCVGKKIFAGRWCFQEKETRIHFKAPNP